MSVFESIDTTINSCSDSGCKVSIQWKFLSGFDYNCVEVYMSAGGVQGQAIAQFRNSFQGQLTLYYANLNELLVVARQIQNDEVLNKTPYPGSEPIEWEDSRFISTLSITLPAPAPSGPQPRSSKPGNPIITELTVHNGWLLLGWQPTGDADIDWFGIATVKNGVHQTPAKVKGNKRLHEIKRTTGGATYDIGVRAQNDILFGTEFSDWVWRRVTVPNEKGWIPPPRVAITGPFDSMATLPDGKTYATFGSQYVRYSDFATRFVDPTYPRPIAGNWGSNLPREFESGFDSMATLPNGKTYITKGNQYIRYSDPSANTIDPGYPRAIAGNWGGNLPRTFEGGFDSMATLPDGKIYITKGNQYVRYSDPNATIVDPTYPRHIAGNWGRNLPHAFESGFDSIATLPNGKTYITKGNQYLRYSDASANVVDPGYPKSFTGNWGTWFQTPSLRLQGNWKWCNKCQTLTFAGNSSFGACPAGAAHDHGGSGNYVLIQNSPDAQGQDNWQWCNKCQGLTFAGGSSLGSCSAGGLHDHGGSGNYVLSLNAQSAQGQSNWQWCNKCQALAFAGNSSLGACPVGGEHNHSGSGMYTLMHE